MWTRPRIALVACAVAQVLAMLYVGLFQIGWTSRLACPLFGVGCESVALAPFAWPLGFADGLLAASVAGLLCAAVQVERREGALAVVALAFLDLAVHVVWLFEMARFHAWDFWRFLSLLLSVPVATLSLLSDSRGRPAAVAPDDGRQQGQ